MCGFGRVCLVGAAQQVEPPSREGNVVNVAEMEAKISRFSSGAFSEMNEVEPLQMSPSPTPPSKIPVLM